MTFRVLGTATHEQEDFSRQLHIKQELHLRRSQYTH